MTKAGVVRLERSRMEALIDRLGHDDTPRVYTDRSVFVRELFWRRLDALLKLSHAPADGRALDFGGGNGILTPTLARRYREAVCVDLRTEMAQEVCRAEGLSNVSIRQGDLASFALPAESFDTIVAADVLEHIQDLRPLIEEFRRLLKPGGELLISAPSENRFYELGRRVFGYTKPDDHYHESAFVDETIRGLLTAAQRRYFPFNLGPLAVFLLARFVKEPA
jgi:ubiquinone/menaquinone biosynthesis C-methylase UbiE